MSKFAPPGKDFKTKFAPPGEDFAPSSGDAAKAPEEPGVVPTGELGDYKRALGAGALNFLGLNYPKNKSKEIGRLSKDFPKIFGGGEIAAATAIPSMGAGSLLARTGVGAGVGGAMGAAQAPEEGGSRTRNAISGLLTGAAGGALSKVLGKKGLESGADALQDTAEKAALRTAGAQKSQVGKLANKGRANEVGRFLLDNDLLDDTVTGAKGIKGTSGKEIEGVLGEIDAAGLKFDAKGAKQKLRDIIVSDPRITNAVDSSKHLSRLNKIISQMPTTGAKDLQSWRQAIGDQVNWNANPLNRAEPAVARGTKKIYFALNDIMQDAANLSKKGGGDRLKGANKTYNLASEAEKLGANKAAQEGNNFFSLTDYLAGGAGGSAAAMASGGVDALPGVVAGLLASKAARTYGPKIATRGADALSKGMRGASKITPIPDVGASQGAIAVEKLRELLSKKKSEEVEE